MKSSRALSLAPKAPHRRLALYVGNRPVQDLDLMAGTNQARPRVLLGDLLAWDPTTEVRDRLKAS